MKIALLQSNPVTGALESNLDALIAASSGAAMLGAELCVAPELALCGHTAGDFLLLSGFADRCRNVLKAGAERMGAAGLPPLLLGAPVANPVPQGKPLQSCAVLLHEGRVSVVGRKVLLPSSGVHDDARYFEPGVACGVLQYKGWRLAVTVGEDIWNDRTFWKGRRTFNQDPVADVIAGGGADALLNLTALPFEQGLPGLHQRMLGHLAARYRVPVAAANLVGGNDSLVYYGGSLGLGRDGALLARARAFEQDVLIVDISGREQGEIVPELVPEEELWRAVVLGTRDYVTKCGFDSVVLGLSGGVDSSLVAAIAVDAFGPDKVTGLLMPSPYSSRGSVDDAASLAANLGIATHTLPITPVLAAYAKALDPLLPGGLAGVAEENAQARIRGNLLMAWANASGSLLLATGNKSEAAVGYGTLYGDLAGAVAPIGDIYKGTVYALCRFYNERHPGAIPESVLTKAPSAELRPGQTDQDSLPPYDVLDELLHQIIDLRESPGTLQNKGFDHALVKDVMRMVQKAEFKRHQAPPALHLSANGFGGGLRMPLAASVCLGKDCEK